MISYRITTGRTQLHYILPFLLSVPQSKWFKISLYFYNLFITLKNKHLNGIEDKKGMEGNGFLFRKDHH